MFTQVVRLSLTLLVLVCHQKRAEELGLIKIQAIGRPFRLGMLYDRRKDQIVPGITLWDQKTLSNITSSPSPSTYLKITTEDSVSDKAELLDIRAELKVSLMAGFIKAEGSGKYISNRVKRSNTARVSLRYLTTTEYKALSMDQLGKGRIKHVNVFDMNLATDVVVGIVYGAQAVFSFDRTVSVKEDFKHIKAGLKIQVAKISFSVDVWGEGKYNNTERQKLNKFKCSFFGDLRLEHSPTTLAEAVNVYKKLPSMIGKKGENAVPVTVYLLPLEKLDRKASKIVKQISSSLVAKISQFIEDLHSYEVKANDLLSKHAVFKFPRVKRHLKAFKNMLSLAKLHFQRDILPIVPQIRGNGKSEKKLADLFIKREASPVGNSALSSWLSDQQSEIEILDFHIKKMAAKKIAFTTTFSQFLRSLIDPRNKYIISYTIQLFPNTDPYIKAANSYLQNKKNSSSNRWRKLIKNEFKISGLRSTMRNAFTSFMNLHERTKRRDVKFIVEEMPSKTKDKPGIYIRIFKHGKLLHNEFEMPSPPGQPKLLVSSYDMISVHWSRPKNSSKYVKFYRVYYKEAKVSNARQKYIDTKGRQTEVQVRNLKPSIDYIFTVVAHCGFAICSEKSKASEIMKTRKKGKYLIYFFDIVSFVQAQYFQGTGIIAWEDFNTPVVKICSILHTIIKLTLQMQHENILMISMSMEAKHKPKQGP